MKKVALFNGRLGEKIHSILMKNGDVFCDINPVQNIYYDIAVICPNQKTNAKRFDISILLSDVEGETPLNILRNKKVITCGMNSTDSVTLSSITERSAAVCIQRKIDAFGKKILPSEYKVNFSDPIEPIALLSAALILILIKYPNDNSKVIEI